MEDLKKLNINWLKVAKILGLILLAVVVLTFLFNFLGTSFSRMGSSKATNSGMMNYAYQGFSRAPTASYDAGMSLSTRNVSGAAGYNSNVKMGEALTAENYEVTDYNATIETRNLKRDCSLVQDLKAKDYVIFESANIAERSCSFSFKVNKDNVGEVLGVIKGLNPRDLSENIQTIKKQIEDFTSQEEILKNKQASIEETLKNAVSAYNEITIIATKTNNADSLAKVIESKVNIIERLTIERININAQLDRLSQSKAEQLERLKYINFNVYIYENKIVDGQQFKDFWKSSVKQFVVNANQLLNDLSLGLVALILALLKYLVYIFLIIIVGKFCWKLAVKIWKK